MNTIFKYPLQLNSYLQQIDMPFGANVLTVQVQNGVVTLWAKVNSYNSPSKRQFIIYGTGHEIDDEGDIYIGTVQLSIYVLHIFERP